MIRLTIVIPAYNAEPYLSELLDCLAPQITDEVEVIVIDDGSRQQVRTDHKWCQVIRQKNQGVGAARNKGIDKAKGEYISFIDSDDLVSKDFVRNILEKTKSHKYDVLEFSWKSLTDKMWKITQKLESDQDRLPNPSVCTRAFKKTFIGSIRFNIKKDSTEDEDFSRKMGYLGHEKDIDVGVIPDFMYFYRDDVPMSKTKRYAKGLMNTKRVVYYYPEVTKDMIQVLEDIKADDETNEVFLMTNNCEIPELHRYCQIIRPQSFWGHILKGEKSPLLEERKPPIRTQVVIYRRRLTRIGGLMTFILNYIDLMAEKYDITILCDEIDPKRRMELAKTVRVLVKPKELVVCDSLIVLSFLDKLPQNVQATKIIRMCHACRTDMAWVIPKDYDELIYVSKTARNSFGDEKGNVIHNFNADRSEKTLILISATRLPAPDKGDIENRMRKLAKMLNQEKIPFLWLNFADGALKDAPENFHNMGMVLNMQNVFRAFSGSPCYCVQLSDSECWSYTVLEALTSNIPLICTPFPSVYEMGVEDGVNAHVVPFDMEFDVRELLEVPEFEYSYDNKAILKQWVEILGKTKPRHDYIPPDDHLVRIRVKMRYFDRELSQYLRKGEIHSFTSQRVDEIMAVDKGLIEILD